MILSFTQEEMRDILADWLKRHKGEIAERHAVGRVRSGRMGSEFTVSLDQDGEQRKNAA